LQGRKTGIISNKTVTIAKPVVITDLVAKKIENATKGLTHSYSKRLLLCKNTRHTSAICDYILAIESELKLSNEYKQSILNTLITLARVGNSSKSKKSFREFTRADVITYLNQFRKDESIDPTHKWIGTYNARLVNVIRFFRWLYYPDLEPTKRPKPKVVQNLARLKRREVSGYKPSDMWNAQDNLIFLKYCPSPRDRTYHAMEADTSARPHELLKLTIKDVEFVQEEGDSSRYAKIVVNGKTGERVVPLIDSIPYVTQWISNGHPQGSNREAILLPNVHTGESIQVDAMFKAYKNYKRYFTSLLSSENVPEEDKKKIRNLLNKRWNPYVHRHSALTEKCGLLNSEAKLKQYAGWTARSNMHYKYVHFGGGESMKDLLKVKGILKDDKHSVNILQPKICPHCKEPNKPDAQFCFKCNFVMSFDAYHKTVEEKEKKDQELQALRNEQKMLKEHMAKMEESQLKITELLEVMKIAKSSDGKIGKDRTMLDEKRRVTIGYVDDNNQSVEMKVPLDGFEIDEGHQ
jgi:integrase/recombinase XerD